MSICNGSTSKVDRSSGNWCCAVSGLHRHETWAVVTGVWHHFWPRHLRYFAYWLWEEPVLQVKATPAHVPYFCWVAITGDETIQVGVVLPLLQLPCDLLQPRQYMLWCSAVQIAPVLCSCHFDTSDACHCRTVLCRHNLYIKASCKWSCEAQNYLWTSYTYCTWSQHALTNNDTKCIPAANNCIPKWQVSACMRWYPTPLPCGEGSHDAWLCCNMAQKSIQLLYT